MATPQTNFQAPGQILDTADSRAMFLKLFPGLVLAAHARTSVMQTRHRTVVVPHGKSYTFPAIGRSLAQYLDPGNNIDDQRIKIRHNERVIEIDGLLTAEAFVPDLYEAMNHFDTIGEYANQLGEALAISSDASVIAELFNMYNDDANVPSASAGTAGTVPGTGIASNVVVGAAPSAVIDADYGQKILNGLLEAQVRLNQNHTPAAQRYFLCTPEAHASIVAALLPFAANYQTMVTPQTGTLTNVAGFEIVPVPHLLQGGVGGKHVIETAVTDAAPIGVAYQYGAVGSVQLRGVKIETGRRINYLSDQIIASMVAGHGGLRPEDVVVFTGTAIA